MGLYNFKSRFVLAILSGRKCHTIRATRKVEDKPGDLMHLYTGLRTKKTELLGRSRCVKVETIEIVGFRGGRPGFFKVTIDGIPLAKNEIERLAVADGFGSALEMEQFWTGLLPFEGKIYHWSPLDAG